jgi:hypothetical protein
MHAIQSFQHNVNHIYNDQGKKETIDTLLAGNDGPTWTNALCNEYGQLAQGFTGNTVIGTDTIDFIHQHEVPPDKKVTYGNLSAIIALSKPSLIEYDSLLVAINFLLTTMLDLLQPLSWRPNSLSTVPSLMQTKVLVFSVLISRIIFLHLS